MIQAKRKEAASLFLNRATLVLLGILLAVPGFAFGGVEGWCAVVVVSLACLLLTIVLLHSCVDSEIRRIDFPWLWLPASAFTLLGIWQIVPLPVSLVSWLSPEQYAWHQPILLESDPIPDVLPLSASPRRTQDSLHVLLPSLAVLFSVTLYCRTKEHVMHVLWLVLALGFLQSCLCIAQIASGAERIYGIVDPGWGGMLTAGSFVNHSHLSQFVNLATGAGLSLLLVRIVRFAQSRNQHGEFSFQSLERQTILLLPIGICLIAVCLSLSRNGVLSMMAGAGAIGMLIARQESLRRLGWILVSVPTAALIVLLVFGFDVFYRRLETLGGIAAYQDRWTLFTSCIEAGRHYFLFGSGIGSFSHVFPIHDTTRASAVATYADNEYGQVFVEGGLAGLIVLILLFATIALRLRHWLSLPSSIAFVAYGLLFGFIAVTMHSASDFGQRIPAIALMSSTLCGVLAARPSLHRDETNSMPKRTRIIGIAAICCIVGLGWAAIDTYYKYQSELWMTIALEHEERLQENDWRGASTDFEALLAAVENAAFWRPNDVETSYWLNYYRWRSITALTPAGQGVDLEILDQLTNDLAEVRRLCPTYHPPYVLEGEIRGYQLQDPSSAETLLATAVELSPRDPTSRFAYGIWLWRQGGKKPAIAQLQKAIERNAGVFDACAELLLESGDLSAAQELAGGQLERLQKLQQLLTNRDLDASGLQKEIEARLREQAMVGDLPAAQIVELARLEAAQENFEAAVGLYRQALATDYSNPLWRYELALVLKALERYEEASREAKMCWRMRKDEKSRALLEELGLLMATTSENR